MKKILFFVFTIIGLNAFAQSLPNNEMEDWSFYLFFDEPDEWYTLNSFIYLLDPGTISVSKSSDSYSGSYAAKLTTHEITDNNIAVPSIITLAEFNINIADSSFSFGGGYYLQENVHKMTGWYKYEGVENDSASILMYNFKNDGSGMDTIGFGFSYLGNADEWQPFEIFMENFVHYVTPDTFNVIITSSKAMDAKAGSVLLIDDISIYTNTGIIDLWSTKKPLKVYPNPATDYITFSSDIRTNDRVLTIYDNFGKTIIKKDFQEQTTKLSLSDLDSGIYTYKLSKGNKILNSGSFIKN